MALKTRATPDIDGWASNDKWETENAKWKMIGLYRFGKPNHPQVMVTYQRPQPAPALLQAAPLM